MPISSSTVLPETLKHEDQANEALTALQHINSSNETELLAWLLKYEALKKELLGLEMEYEDLEITGNKHFTFSDFTIQIHPISNYCIDSSCNLKHSMPRFGRNIMWRK